MPEAAAFDAAGALGVGTLAGVVIIVQALVIRHLWRTARADRERAVERERDLIVDLGKARGELKDAAVEHAREAALRDQFEERFESIKKTLAAEKAECEREIDALKRQVAELRGRVSAFEARS